jgi:hypothetical protein
MNWDIHLSYVAPQNLGMLGDSLGGGLAAKGGGLDAKGGGLAAKGGGLAAKGWRAGHSSCRKVRHSAGDIVGKDA